jgi:hypothetical protein
MPEEAAFTGKFTLVVVPVVVGKLPDVTTALLFPFNWKEVQSLAFAAKLEDAALTIIVAANATAEIFLRIFFLFIKLLLSNDFFVNICYTKNGYFCNHRFADIRKSNGVKKLVVFS